MKLPALLSVAAPVKQKSYTPEVTIKTTPTANVKVTRRATNQTPDILITVNKDTKITFL